MITAIKSTNNDLYKALFEKASEILSGFKSVQTYENDQTYYYRDALTKSYIALVLDGETDNDKIMQFANALTEYNKLYIKIGDCVNGFVPELGITTLEEYYNWLPLLKSEGDKPTIFTKLPLDEPYFTINAETRAINIPADFKKNGIAVQGDDLAEVVYFMIDRYFDAVDLNNTEIFIEWETPKGKDGVATKSISEPYLKIIDDENYRGKLIFGWAISKAITENAGTLKFSVRFIDRSESTKKIEYMFNTLTAQVNINPSLGLKLTDEVIQSADNCNDRLLERITESVVVGGAQAAVPEFLLDLNDEENFSYDIIPDIDGSYKLQVVAKASDTGFISCVWKKAELDENNNELSWREIPNSNNFEMIPLTEEELTAFNYILPAGRQYAVANDDDTYTSLTADELDLKNTFENIPTIYENRATLIVTDAGKYKAEARNRIFNSLTKKNSKIATFKRPDFVVLNNDNQTIDQHIIDETSATLKPIVIEAPGTLSYQWYKLNTADEINNYEPIPNATSNTFTATTEGFYKLTVTRIRNNRSTFTDSFEYRVTEAPIAPTFAKGTFVAYEIISVNDLISGNKTLDISWINTDNDGYEITWYLSRQLKGQEDLALITQRVDKDICTASLNPTDPMFAEILNAANEDVEASYYATIRTKLNGVYSNVTEKPDLENMFSVTGA